MGRIMSSAESHEDIEDWLIARFSQITDVAPDQIDVNRPFVDYRLDSALAVTLSREFSDWLGRELPITLFWEHPTIRSLALAVVDEGAGGHHVVHERA